MPGPTPTFNPNALDNLFKSIPEVYKPPITSGGLNFQAPVSGHGGIDFPYSHSKNKAPSDPMVDGLRNLFSSGPTEKFMTSTIKYNADEVNAARYVTSPDYLKLGISLTGNNEENYGQNQSWSEVLSNGLSGMGKLAANGFVDGWKQWGRTFDALSHWDWNRLHGDAESMLELDNNLKDIMNSNPIYATKEGSDTFWNRQTFGNFLQQSGFAVGALAQVASEQILTKAIEAVLTTSIVGAPEALLLEGATDVKSAATLSRIGNFFNKSKEFFNTSKAVTALKKLGDIWKNDAIVKKFVTGLGQRLPGVDVAMDISKVYKTGMEAGLSGTQLAGDIAKVGFGGLKRTMSEANFAFTEARMEAAGTFGDLYNQMQEDHFKRTGTFAEGNDLQNMQDIAMKAADKNFNFNSAVLAVSNRIMFDNVFKNSKITSKILSQFGEDVGERGFKVLGKINGKTTSQYYTGNVLKNYKTIAADFGTRKARTVLAKSIMKPALKFEVSEGIQELLQEGSAEYYKDYYLNSYKATYNPNIEVSSQKSLDKAISSQMTMQGLKTFASGALTGMLLHGPTVLIGKAGSKLSEKVSDTYKTSKFTKEEKEKYFEEKKASKDELKNYYNEFNALAKDPSKFFSESIKNFNVQKEGSSALDEAAKLGDKFGYENIRTDMLHSMVSQAVRNDTHEALADTLREYGKHMSKEEFEQAFVGLDYNSENKKSAADYTEKVAKSVESYGKIYNKLQEKYGSRVNPNRYAKGSKEYNNELSKKQVLNNMIDILAGNEFKSIDAAERSLSLYTKAGSNKTLGASLASTYNILGSEGNIKKEISVLDLDIEIKNEQLKSDDLTKDAKDKLKTEIKLKEQQKESLQEWLDNKDDLSDKPKLTKSYEAFKNYLELKNKEFGKDITVNINEVEDLFVDFNDYIKLNKKSQKHIDAVNMLSNPRYFDQVYKKMALGSRLAYQQLLQEAAKEEIKAGLNEPNKHFILESNGMYGVFTPGGEVLNVFDTIEEAREEKEILDKAIFSEDALEELFKNNEVTETEEPAAEKTEEKTPAKTEEKKEVKLLINGKVATIISEEIDKKDNLKVFEYVFDNDAEKEIYQFKLINGKAIDTDTGEQITISAVKTKEKLGDKSIDEQIEELEAKIQALPNKGMVAEGDMVTSSKERDDLKNQIKELKAKKEAKKEVTTTSDIEAKKADIEKRRQEELDRETPVKNENIIVNDGTDSLTFKIITFKDGSTLVRHIKTNETTADNKSKKLITYPTLEDFQNLLKYDFDENAKIIKTELVKDNYDDKQSQEIKAAKEKTINAKYDAEIAALKQQPATSTSTPKLNKEELKKSNPEFFNKDGNISIADMSNDTFIKFMSGVIFDLKNEIESNNSPYTVIQSLVDSLGPNMTSGASSTLLLAASEETKNYLKEIYNFYQNSVYGKNYWRSGMEENLKKYGIQKLIDKTNEIITRDNITTFKKIDSLSLDEYLKIKLGFSFLFQYPNQNRFYTDFLFNPETNQTLFRIPSKQVLDDFKEINKIFRENNVPGYSEIKEKFLKLENFKNLSEEELIDLYNTKNLTLDNFNSVKNKSTVEEQPVTSTPKLTKEEALENLKEIFKENAFLYEEKELSNVDINKFNTVAVDLYNVAKNILTEQELNKVLEKLSISDVNNLPLNKAIELSIGLKGVLLSRENISDKVNLARGFSDKSNYDYLINNIPFNDKFIIVTEDSLKRDQDIRNFIYKFVKKLKDNNVGGISNVAYEGFIIQVDYGIEKPNTEQLLSSLLNQVNEALVQFGNPKLNTQQYKVSIETYNKGNKEVSYQVVYQDKYKPIDSNNQIIDTFNLTLPEDLESILFNYTIEVKGNKKLIIAPNNSINVDFNIAKKYGLPTKPNKFGSPNDYTLILDLNQPVTSTESEEEKIVKTKSIKEIGLQNISVSATAYGNKPLIINGKKDYDDRKLLMQDKRDFKDKFYFTTFPSRNNKTQIIAYIKDNNLDHRDGGYIALHLENAVPDDIDFKEIQNLLTNIQNGIKELVKKGSSSSDTNRYNLDTVTNKILEIINNHIANTPDKVETKTEDNDNDTIDDIDQAFDSKKKDILDTDSTEVDKIFQEGIKQTAPALSLGNRTHAVNVVEIEPGKERFERGDVNNTYEFEIATPTFMPGKSVTFKVDEFDGKNYNDANIGIYTIIEGKETRIGAVHTPQWIAEQKGPNKAYTHIVIPESEKYDEFPKTLVKEIGANKKLRKLILDNYKNNSNFVLNGTINDKSIGIILTMNAQGTLAERLNPEISKGGLENRHGMFGIIRGGFIELTKGHKIDISKIVPVKSFNVDNISQYEGYSIMLIPTPTGTYFPTFIKLPNVAREQSEFILKAWKAFTGKETDADLVQKVYKAVGAEYVKGAKIDIEVLKSYIDHYITNLNSKSLSQLGNGNDAPDNTSRIDIDKFNNLKIQGKLKGEWKTFTIKDKENIPDDILDYMDNLITTIRFTNSKNDSLLGINSTDKIIMFGVKNNELYSKEMTYNQYIMEGAKTYLEKGIESKNEYNDWVYFANPVLKFEYTEPTINSLEETLKSEKPEVNLADVTEVSKEDKAALFLAALKANSLKNKQIDEQKDKCSTK